MFSTNNKQLYNDININNPQSIIKNTEIISNNRLISLINRNRGKLEINPIDDLWDEDPLTDLGLDVNSTDGVSEGTLANLKDS
jgi:hypothetical protein